MKTYLDTTIEKDYRGYFTALVLTRDRILGGSYYQSIQSDTLQGIKKLIKYYKEV
jgi:hypothetical protein